MMAGGAGPLNRDPDAALAALPAARAGEPQDVADARSYYSTLAAMQQRGETPHTASPSAAQAMETLAQQRSSYYAGLADAFLMIYDGRVPPDLSTPPLDSLAMPGHVRGLTPAAPVLDSLAALGASIDSLPQPLRVYPNPNAGQFTVELLAVSGLAGQLTVLDAMGQVVYQAAHLPGDQVPIQVRQRGLYTVRVRTTDGQTFHSQVVVQ